MESLASLCSASGRFSPRPFVYGVLVVYALSFLSQVLISPALTARWGVWTFALVQAALVWAWFAFHARRLRDAGLSSGPALAVVVLYALAVILLILLVDPIIGTDIGAAATELPRPRFADLWVFLLVIAALAAEPSANLFYMLSLAMLALIITPIAIALGFSVWAATRTSIATPQVAS